MGEDVEEREPCVLLVGMEPGAATVENRRFRRKVQTERPCDAAAPLPGTRRSLLVVLRGQRDPISAPKATGISSAAGVRGALYPPSVLPVFKGRLHLPAALCSSSPPGRSVSCPRDRPSARSMQACPLSCFEGCLGSSDFCRAPWDRCCCSHLGGCAHTGPPGGLKGTVEDPRVQSRKHQEQTTAGK